MTQRDQRNIDLTPLAGMTGSGGVGIPACPRCGVPGEAHADSIGCADALIAYYAGETGRCTCGAPVPCFAPRFGGEHVRPEVWLRWEAANHGE